MKLSQLKYKPFTLGCCENDCDNYNKDIKKCLQPMCQDLMVHNMCEKCEGRGKLRNNIINPKPHSIYQIHFDICNECNGSGLQSNNTNHEVKETIK